VLFRWGASIFGSGTARLWKEPVYRIHRGTLAALIIVQQPLQSSSSIESRSESTAGNVPAKVKPQRMMLAGAE
jgi:hypothetical protein